MPEIFIHSFLIQKYLLNACYVSCMQNIGNTMVNKRAVLLPSWNLQSDEEDSFPNK